MKKMTQFLLISFFCPLLGQRGLSQWRTSLKSIKPSLPTVSRIPRAPFHTYQSWVERFRATQQELFNIFIDALRAHDYEAISGLLQEGANINMTDAAGRTPLMYAIWQEENPKMVEFLVEKGADVDLADDLGRAPLMYAINKGNLDMVKFLINKGSDVNSRANDGFTPLLQAVEQNNDKMVRVLLAEGAEINAQDDAKAFPGTPPAVRVPLHMAVRKGNIDMVKFLLSKGADVNAQLSDKTTPLHIAVFEGADMVDLLLSKGADVKSEDIYGETPFGLALKHTYSHRKTYQNRGKEVLRIMHKYSDEKSSREL